MDDLVLTEEMVLGVLKSLPSTASQAMICDLIINILLLYGMEEDFHYMSLVIIGKLERMNTDDYVRDGTKPIH
jgi:hypothetical protein